MQFPFHIFLLKIQPPFFLNIKVNTTSKTVCQEREEEKATHSSQVRIVFLPTIATYFKCCSYSYRKPKTIRWKKHWNLLESTYKHKHCTEVSRYFISVCSKGNTDESVKVKIYLWPNPLISELGRLRQEDWYEVRASLSLIKPLSPNKNKRIIFTQTDWRMLWHINSESLRILMNKITEFCWMV